VTRQLATFIWDLSLSLVRERRFRWTEHFYGDWLLSATLCQRRWLTTTMGDLW